MNKKRPGVRAVDETAHPRQKNGGESRENIFAPFRDLYFKG